MTQIRASWYVHLLRLEQGLPLGLTVSTIKVLMISFSLLIEDSSSYQMNDLADKLPTKKQALTQLSLCQN